ncbi:unnamed protein product [Clonostachys byssicola]|uniref:Uncharacterized protein n=1 Tax=Clonostachys byssicola TaxID=160290 RepID=A0A9N9U4P0_9HYPO|nr:unnamed protein product [Clonostachys byssicola]
MPSCVLEKDKKHAKNHSGIAAAVTEQTAGKFALSNGNQSYGSSGNSSTNPSLPTSTESTPPINTPDVLRPTSVTDNAIQSPSPLLDAISNASISASTVPSMNNDWARAGGMAGSPGNLISIMGDSPPTQPSSYEDSSLRAPSGWPAQRALATPSPASLSPPNNIRRPLSFQLEAHYQHPEPLPQMSSAAHRRSSLHSQLSHARNSSHPPLPHQPQPHYYGAPDLDLTLRPRSGITPGDRGYFFGFDSLPVTGGVQGAADNVVIAGFEGGLDIYAVSKKGIEPVAGLKGLRGGVVHAKILPWTVTGEQRGIFPLIAVVLHGPVIPSGSSEAAPDLSNNPSPRLDGAASPRSAFGPPEGLLGQQSSASIKAYQTSVQIYSLKTNKLVDTLLQSPQIPISTAVSLTSPIFQPPPPSGSLTIKADAGTVIVCSGVTGECWVYLQLLEPQNESIFACVGKLWTCTQQRRRTETPEGSDKTHASALPSRSADPTPIIALNGRWIAYCPAAPSSQLSLKAHVPVPLLGRSNTALSLTPPQLPLATASVDLISDSIMNKIMRETTQELISGAKWVGQQGLQAWNAYWNKSPSPQPQSQAARPPPAAQFPPTHGTPGQSAPKEPGIVSIVDAESLAVSSTVHPITSFVPPQGCSFLSFAPTSLALFTASSKGDVQNVWDLLRIQYTKSSPIQASVSPGESAGPQVRQIAHFSRMTVARIVDVVWAEPHGESLAVLTERGTVHLLEMPFSASMWPPPRRRKAVPEANSETAETSSNSAVSIAAGAFGAAYQAARPFVARSRRKSASPSTGNANTFKDSAAHGGRVIAASISSSLGKTGTAISQLRNTAENRVSLPSSPSPPGPSCVRWVRGRKSHSLYILGGGVIRIFPNKVPRSSSQPARRVSRYKDINLPSLPDDVIAPAIRQILDLGMPDDVFNLSDRDLEAENTVTLPRPRMRADDQSFEAAIPQAEIESSAPYQPFHTDRRVALCEYTRQGDPGGMDSLVADLENVEITENSPPKKKKGKQQSSTPNNQIKKAGIASAWAFGQDIPVVKLDLGILPITGDDGFEGLDDQALPPSAMERVMEYGDQEQIVVTTRKRRTARQGDAEGDGFFEDDCEVLDFADQRV